MSRPLGIVLLLAVAAAPLPAQGGRFPRKWLVAGVGALVTGVMAGAYAVAFERDIGGCSKASCVVPVSVAFGAAIGFMIGSEMDRLYDLRYAHAPPMDLGGRELPLAVLPQDLALERGTVLVTGTEGIELVRAGPTLERIGFRARGLRGIGPIAADSATNRLLVGSPVGLYRFPLRGEDPGTLSYPGEISALSGDSSLLALGLGPAVQLARVDDSVTALGPAQAEEARVVDLAWQGDSVLWVLTEDRLVAYARLGDSLAPRGALTLAAIGRRLALRDSLALVAAGSGGVVAVDVRDPTAPIARANWSGARFCYDVAELAGTVYVAAGPEGLYALRLDTGTFTPLGLARAVGFTAALEAGPDALYVLDRASGVLRRIEPERH